MYPELTHIAIVCDCPLYLRGLVGLVTETPGLQLVAAARTVGDLGHPPDATDVVLLDLPRPIPENCGAVGRLRRRGPAVIVIRASEARSDAIAAIQAGAGGYLSQQVEEAELLTAIRTVAQGRSYICAHLAVRREPEGPIHVTDRERQILKLVAEGCTDREIAVRLEISEHTVHSHLDRLRDKTASRRRADLTRFAIVHGIAAPMPLT